MESSEWFKEILTGIEKSSKNKYTKDMQ